MLDSVGLECRPAAVDSVSDSGRSKGGRGKSSSKGGDIGEDGSKGDIATRPLRASGEPSGLEDSM